MNRNHFSPPFSPHKLPAWHCPNCEDGALSVVKESQKYEETGASKEWRSISDWEPDWERTRFSIMLRCNRCADPILGVGNIAQIEEYNDEFGWVLAKALVPSYFEPAVPVIRIPKSCPEEVSKGILDASALFWSAPSSAGNRLRASIERLMDALGVAPAPNLHARIEAYTITNSDLGGKLLAVKWLGNTGSHSDDLSSGDVLDAFELLEDVLEQLYDNKSGRLKTLANTINTRRGPAPK